MRCSSARTRSWASSSSPPPSSASSSLARSPQGAVADGALFLSLDYDHRQAVCMGGLAFSNPTRVVWEAAAAVAFTAFCAAATISERRRPPRGDPKPRRRLSRHGPSRESPLTATAISPTAAAWQPRPDKRVASVTERVDVCIVGSGLVARSLPGGWRSSTGPPIETPALSSWSGGVARATRTSASRWTSTTSPTSMPSCRARVPRS